MNRSIQQFHFKIQIQQIDNFKTFRSVKGKITPAQLLPYNVKKLLPENINFSLSLAHNTAIVDALEIKVSIISMKSYEKFSYKA